MRIIWGADRTTTIKKTDLRIYKELQISKKSTNNPLKNERWRHFTEKGILMLTNI